MSRSGGVPVRVTDAGITSVTAAGRTASRYRPVTTPADPGRYPAGDVIALLPRAPGHRDRLSRAQVHHARRPCPARRTPDGIDQEICAVGVTCQAIRSATADAAATVPGTDPGRASFTIALNTARDQVILAAGVTAGPVTGLAGDIGRAAPASLMPGRRPRISPRVVKRALSRYRTPGKIDRATRKATINIAIIAPPSQTTTRLN